MKIYEIIVDTNARFGRFTNKEAAQQASAVVQRWVDARTGKGSTARVLEVEAFDTLDEWLDIHQTMQLFAHDTKANKC